jgi:hypothetical protein
MKWDYQKVPIRSLHEGSNPCGGLFFLLINLPNSSYCQVVLLVSKEAPIPYLIVQSCYPNDKATEVGNTYLEALKKFPPNENLGTLLVPAAVKGTYDGIQNIGVSEVNKGKLDESYTYLVNMMAMFHKIQGFRYKIDVYLRLKKLWEF